MDERKQWKQKLDEAAAPYHFNEQMKQNVMNRAKPSIWEREIMIPLPVFLVPLLFVLVSIGALSLDGAERFEQKKPNQDWHTTDIIILDSGVFYERDLEKRQTP